MSTTGESSIARLLSEHEKEIFEMWLDEQLHAETWRPDLISEKELRADTREFLQLLTQALQPVQSTNGANGAARITARTSDGTAYEELKAMLDRLSAARAEAGFSPAATATFVFSIKQPVFAVLREELQERPEDLITDLWSFTVLVDDLGLYTTDRYLATREAIIRRQQQELLELSTPVVKVWDGVLALPLIGTLDSSRTQTVMENLLTEIVATRSTVAIIDITGVETVDTLVAQHLLKTVAAAKLMGAECIISGIRPQIAQMVVQLAIDLSEVSTKATLADALAEAFERTRLRVVAA